MSNHTMTPEAAAACVEDVRQLAAEAKRHAHGRRRADVDADVLLERIGSYGSAPARKRLRRIVDVPMGAMKPVRQPGPHCGGVACSVDTQHSETWGEVTYQARVTGTPGEALDLAFGLLVVAAGELGDARLREHVVAACSEIDRVLERIGHETSRCDWCGGVGERYWPRSGWREQCTACGGTGRDCSWTPESKRDAMEVA